MIMKKRNLRKPVTSLCRLVPLWLMLLVMAGSINRVKADPLTYTFSQSSGVYSPIAGTILSGSNLYTDDTNFPLQNIGFTFVYNGTPYTTVGISANGYIRFGATTSTIYSNVLGSSMSNVIAMLSGDLLGNASGHNIQTLTTGAVGSRVFTIQFTNWGVYSSGANEYNFQLKLFETTNQIRIIYGSFSLLLSSGTRQVGLRGVSSSAFSNRTTTSNWSATGAGALVSSTCTVNSLVKPSNGLTFIWTPSVVSTPPTCASGLTPAGGSVNPISLNQLSWSATSGATGYDVYFGTSASPALVSSNQPGTTYNVALAGSSTYYYQIVPRNAFGPATGCSILSFSTNNDYYLPNGTTTITSCNLNFYDIGGPGGAYQANANQTVTFYPAIPGNSIAVNFTSFQTESGWDPLYIYNGPNNTYPLFNSGNGPSNTGFPAGGYWGTALPGPFVSSDGSGALTITFRSDGSVQQAGWTAQISCVAPTPPSCSNSNVPADGANNVYRNQPLTWTSGSPNTAYYNVYFGTSPSPALVSSNQAGTSYNPGLLSANTTYYYQIVPGNNYGLATGCPVNSFTTGVNLLYCTPTYSSNCSSGDYINNFTFNTISNLSTGCNGPYTFFPASGNTTTSVNRSITYQVSMSSGASWSQGFGVWIDYNQNGNFSDAGEFVFGTLTVPLAGSTVLANVTIPATAQLGVTRMRVRCAWSTNPVAGQSCSNMSFGEAEDYAITILPEPPPIAVSASSSTICEGSVNGSTLSVTTGLALYQNFTWAPAAGLSGTTGASVLANPATTTTYTLTATTIADNLTNSATVTITVLPKPVVTITEPNHPGNPVYLCGGGSIQPVANATLNLCGGGTFAITISGSGFLDESSWNIKNSANVIIASGGPYGYGSTNLTTITTAAVPLTLYIETQGTFNDNVANYSVVCSGNTIVSGTVNGGNNQTINNICCGGGVNNITSYSWTSIPAGFTSNLANPLINPPSGSTTYEVDVLGVNGCNSVASINVVSTPVPAPKYSPNDTILCTGSIINVSFIDTGAYAGGYPVGTSFDYGFGPTPIPGFLINGPGLYNVIVQLPAAMGGCIATSPYANIQYNDAPIALVGQVNVACFGESNGSITADAVLGMPPYRFKWYDQSGVVVRNVVTMSGSDVLNGLAAGVYSVVISDNANGTGYPPPVCQSDSIVVNITQPAQLLLSATKIDELCFGQSMGSVDLNLSGGVEPFSFLWSNTATTEDISSRPAGSYDVVVTQGNGCTNQLTSTITEPALLTSSITKSNYNGSDISCFGLSDGSANLSVGGGTTPYQYAWSNLAVTQDISGLSSGTYSVIVTDDHGCVANASVTLNDPPAVAISSAGVTSDYNGSQVSCFGSKDGIITVIANGGTGALSYQLNLGLSQASGVFEGLGSGNYVILVKDVNNCSLSSNAIEVTDPQQLTASSAVTSNYNGSQVSCFGLTDGAISVSANGGTGALSYKLNGGAFQSSNVFPGLGANIYSCLVQDINGCSVTTDAVSIVNPPPVTGSAAVTSDYHGRDVSCFGSTDGIITLQGDGGTGVLNYRKVGGLPQFSAIFGGLGAGDYDFVVTDLNNCNITTPKITVLNPPLLTSSLAATSATYWHASNGTATVVADGGTTPYAYLWNDPALQTNATATGLMARTTPVLGYTATVTDVNGCTVSGSVIITEPAYICGNPKEFTDGQIGQWGGPPSGTNYTYPLSGGQIPNYLAANFAAAFPSPGYLRIGCGNNWLVFTHSGAIAASLPSGGTARQLNPGTMVNPTSAQYSNQFASRLVAAKLNVLFDAWDPLFSGGPTVTAGDMIYTGNVTEYYGKSLKWLIAHADSVIGCGTNDATKYSKLSTVMSQINNGQYSCPANVPIKTEGALQEFSNRYFKVYPNPTNGLLALDFFGNENQPYTVEIMDMVGKTILKNETKTTSEGITQLYFNLGSQPKGMYLIRLTMEGKTEFSKLILQ